MKSFLEKVDATLFDWLMKHPDAVPLRFRKFLAASWPDARVRKLYWGLLNVEMGEGTFANAGLLVVNTLDQEARITIGSQVSIAPGVILVTDSSPGNSEMLMYHPYVRERLLKRAPIVIGDDAWIGANAIILRGVAIGPRAIVAAGAVVTQDVAADTIVAGNPARPVRALDAPQTEEK